MRIKSEPALPWLEERKVHYSTIVESHPDIAAANKARSIFFKELCCLCNGDSVMDGTQRSMVEARIKKYQVVHFDTLTLQLATYINSCR